MLRKFQLLSIVIAIPAVACADLVVSHVSDDTRASAASAVRSVNPTQWERTDGSLDGVGYPAGSGILQPPLQFAPASQTRIVAVIPPEPDSASLVLWALGSAAVWQLGRSTGKVGLHMAPDWYHAGGPAQVGHATPFDLDFSSLPLCCFEQPISSRCGFSYLAPDYVTCCDEKVVLVASSPRAPPIQ